MKATINPNVTVQEVPWSALEDCVSARDEQQKLEQQIKKIKGQIKGIEEDAQAEALAQLAKVNGLVDVEPAVYPLLLAESRVKTFEYNPQFKIQVSFTTQLRDDEQLREVQHSLEAEQEALKRQNEAEINVLLAERDLLDKKIVALTTSPKINGLQTQLSDLRDRLTLPVVKSMALKKA